MDYEHRNGYPHWQSDGSYTQDSTAPGSYIIPARALNIIWGNDPRFWQWIKLSDAETQLIGFREGVLLLQVNWIEVTMKLDLSLFKALPTNYRVYYVVKFGVDAFGWHTAPIKFKLRINGGEEQVESLVFKSYRAKEEEWHEIPGGEFLVPEDSSAGIVEFGMFEVDSDWWKGGMVLAGVKVKPTSVAGF